MSDTRPWSPRTDTAGVLAAVGSGFLLTCLAAGILDAPQGVVLLALALGLVCLAGGALLLRGEPSLRQGLVAAGRVWTEPPGGWVFAVAGAAVFLPFFALQGSTLLGPSGNNLIGDADSARLVSSVRHVWSGHPEFLVKTQEFVLPHVLYGPALALFGVAGAIAVSLATWVAFGALVAYVTWHLTRSPLAAVVAAFALAAVNIQTRFGVFLQMYPLALLLGYGGSWCAYLAIARAGRRRWWPAIAAGLLLALAPEAHSIGQLFWGVPALLLVLGASRERLVAVFRVYVALAVFLVPRLVVNVAEGGLSHLRSGRVDYWVTQGYIPLINRTFLDKPGGRGVGSYLQEVAATFASQATWPFVAVVLLVLAAAALSRGRARWFAGACAAVLVASLMVTQVPLYPRYYSPLLPGAAIAAGGAVALLQRRFRDRSWLSAAAAAVVVVAGTYGFAVVGAEVQGRRAAVAAGPYHELAAAIDDDKAVIGVRGHQLNWVDADVAAYGAQFLSEDEYVTYLTWPSDEAVTRMLAKHDIGWILTMPKRRLEVAYNNAWLGPAHGKQARHFDRLPDASAICHVTDIQGYDLYRVAPCP